MARTDQCATDGGFVAWLCESATKSTIDSGKMHHWVRNEEEAYIHQWFRTNFHEFEKYTRFKSNENQD